MIISFSCATKITSGQHFPETNLESDLGIITEIETLELATSLLWIPMHSNGPESTNLGSLQVFCGSVADLHPDWQHQPWDQLEDTSLCGSQPPMTSPSLFSHRHFWNIHTFLQRWPSPVRKHFITLLLLAFLQFLFDKKHCRKSGMYADSVQSPETVSDWESAYFYHFLFYCKQLTFESCPVFVLPWIFPSDWSC